MQTLDFIQLNIISSIDPGNDVWPIRITTTNGIYCTKHSFKCSPLGITGLFYKM